MYFCTSKASKVRTVIAPSPSSSAIRMKPSTSELVTFFIKFGVRVLCIAARALARKKRRGLVRTKSISAREESLCGRRAVSAEGEESLWGRRAVSTDGEESLCGRRAVSAKGERFAEEEY